MSRGAGRVQRIIEALFNANPASCFTTDELMEACFPGVAHEKRHRVSVLRAAENAARRMRWDGFPSSHRGRLLVYANTLNLTSYATARIRARAGRWGIRQDAIAATMADTTGRGHAALIAPGGTWWRYIEANRLEYAGQHDEAKAMRDGLDKEAREFWTALKDVMAGSGRR